MRVLLTTLAAAALLTAPAAAAAMADAQAAAPARPSEAAVAALSRLILPRDLVIENEVRIARQGMEVGFASEADGKALMESYPKLMDVMWVAAEPEVRRFSETNYVKHERELIGLLQARLSPEQVAALTDFYGTPTGRKLITGMYNNIDGKGLLEKVVARPDADISKADLERVQADAVAKSVKGIGPQDEAALEGLVRRVGMPTLATVGSAIQELGFKWANEKDQAFEDRIATIMGDAADRHITETDAGK